MNIEDWRKLAEFYLCPNCIQKYKVYFEPKIRHLLLNPIDDWREVESNITRMVMITEGVSKGNIEILSFTEDPYFIWDEENEWRLIKFLKNNYSIDWIKTAKIKRSRNTIKLFTEKNNLSLSLNTEKAKVSLKIDDVRTYELNVKMEKNTRKIIYKEDKEGSNELFEEIKWEDFQKIKLDWSFAKKIDTLHKKQILRDCSYRVLKEANEVRNKIHDPSIVAPFSEQDLKLFSDAHAITDKLLIATNGGFGETISTNFKAEAEKLAKECLLKLN